MKRLFRARSLVQYIYLDLWVTTRPESLAIVKTLQSQGYQTAMLSDVTQYQAEIIRKMGYYDLFTPVLLSCEIGVKKPNPEAFQTLLQKLKLPASSVLFISSGANPVYRKTSFLSDLWKSSRA